MRETRETIDRGGRVVRPAHFLGMSRMTKMRRRAPTLSAAVFGALAAILLLAFPATEPAAAAFPGVNGKIVFNDYNDVYSMNPDGSGLRQLTTQNAVADRDPQWSPDGTKVAFLSDRDEVANPQWAGDFVAEIYVMNADGTNARRITNNVFDEYDPTWSPDGRKLVYTREGQGGRRRRRLHD